MTYPSKKKTRGRADNPTFFFILDYGRNGYFFERTALEKRYGLQGTCRYYFRLQLEYTELRQQYEMMLLRLDLGNDDEEYD